MKKYLSAVCLIILIALIVFTLSHKPNHKTVLLNVAYDVIRDFYQDYNPWFLQQTGLQDQLSISQSHGGASKQAIAVASGLPADVVTLTQSSDIDILVNKGLVAADWQQQYPNNASPFGSVMVLLVKKGNPKHIQDWSDLARPDVKVILPNPKTSANGRFAYLAIWAYAQRHFADPQQQQQFLQQVLANVPILEAGARGATISFTQRQMGDVLIAPENEAALASKALGDSFDLVYPSLTLYTPVFVAEVVKNTQHNHTVHYAQQYLQTLWSPAAQQLAAKHYFRPVDQQVAKQYQASFPAIEQLDANQTFGSWQQINAEHFADNGLFDRLYIAAQAEKTR